MPFYSICYVATFMSTLNSYYLCYCCNYNKCNYYTIIENLFTFPNRAQKVCVQNVLTVDFPITFPRLQPHKSQTNKKANVNYHFLYHCKEMQI